MGEFGKTAVGDFGTEEYQNANSTSRSSPYYSDPRARFGFDALMKSAQGQGNEALRGFYQTNLTNQDDPYTRAIISAERPVAEQDFKNRLSQVRSSGYRGGTGRDTINQGMFASDFTNNQSLGNARLLSEAFGRGQDRSLAAAQGFQGLNAQQLASAAALIQALMGNETTNTARNDLETKSHTTGDMLNISSAASNFI